MTKLLCVLRVYGDGGREQARVCVCVSRRWFECRPTGDISRGSSYQMVNFVESQLTVDGAVRRDR
eukprot:998699-Prymnesium_polylepis.1